MIRTITCAARIGDNARRALADSAAQVFLAVLALTLVQVRAAAAGINEWTTNGPLGAGVNTVAVNRGNPGTVYAGTAGKGVFKSYDGGETWWSASVGMGEIYVESVVVHPIITTFVYATSPNHGVFRSIDAGESWTAVNAGLPSPSAHHLAVGPISAIVYVTTNDGLFVSYDGGSHWVPTALRTMGGDGSGDDLALTSWIDCLGVDPTTAAIYACYFTWSNTVGPFWELLRSTDDGASWQGVPLPSGGGPVGIAIDGGAPSAIYVATYEPYLFNSRVLKTTDSGSNWETVGGAMPGCEDGCFIGSLALDDRRPRTVYAATDHGVYVARDGSTAWGHPDIGMGGRWVANVAVDPGDAAVIHAATSDGVFSIRQETTCTGDCNGDGAVQIGDLVTLIQTVLEGGSVDSCGPGGSGMPINDIVAAIGHALHGCQGA